MAKRLILLLLLAVLIGSALPGRAHATGQKGLLITPLRQFLSADAGNSIDSKFTVANLTDHPLDVAFTVKQFSVANLTYDYEFNPPVQDWLHLSLTGITLQARQTRSVAYTITVPANAKPGGMYYTLFASANVADQGVKSTIQAADLLYLTINGTLTTTSHLQSASMPWIAFGRTIPYRLQPINTGNVHFFAYTSGQLHGLFVRPASAPSTHILMPGKPRALQGSIASPILPGVYRATFGYKTDTGSTVSVSRWVVFIPPWFIAVLLGGLLLAGKFLRRAQSTTKNKAKDLANNEN